MKNLVPLLIAIFFLACSSGKEKSESASVAEVEDSIPDLPDPDVDADDEMVDAFIENGDSITIPEFEIEMVLSDRAEKKLTSDDETIIVQAYLAGLPKDGVTVELTEMNELALGSPHIELIDSRVARFTGVNIAKADFDMLKDKDFQILINIFTGRRSSPLNLLDSDVLEEPLSKTRGKRHVLKAKLIGE